MARAKNNFIFAEIIKLVFFQAFLFTIVFVSQRFYEKAANQQNLVDTLHEIDSQKCPLYPREKSKQLNKEIIYVLLNIHVLSWNYQI
jgi:hypothetical protein